MQNNMQNMHCFWRDLPICLLSVEALMRSRQKTKLCPSAGSRAHAQSSSSISFQRLGPLQRHYRPPFQTSATSNTHNMSNTHKYGKYAEYNKKSLIGTQNRLPGFASSLPGTGCHKKHSRRRCRCHSRVRPLQLSSVPPPPLDKPGAAAGADAAERPGSAEACALGFSTGIRSYA